MLEWEGWGEVCVANSFLETRRADEQAGVFVAVPAGILETTLTLAQRQRPQSRDVIYEGCWVTCEVHLLPLSEECGVSRSRRVEVAQSVCSRRVVQAAENVPPIGALIEPGVTGGADVDFLDHFGGIGWVWEAIPFAVDDAFLLACRLGHHQACEVVPLVECAVRQQYVTTASLGSRLEITYQSRAWIGWVECNRSKVLRYTLLPTGAIEVTGLTYSHIVDRRQSYGVVPSRR